MQAPLQIAFHNADGAESVKGLIEEKASWLDRFYNRITACRVVVERQGQRGGARYRVRIDLSVPGGEIVVDREPPARGGERQDLEAAVRSAFDAARRQVEEYARKLRSEVKTHEPAPHARISQIFAEEGYGFLMTPDGREIYFHRNAVLNGDFEKLRTGAEVIFTEAEGEKGPQASGLRLADRA